MPKKNKNQTKPRYIHRQKNKATCVPIALANLLKWRGQKASLAKMMTFFDIWGSYVPQRGVRLSNIHVALRKLKQDFTFSRGLTQQKLDELLTEGKSVILCLENKAGSLHAFLLIGATPRSYIGFNKNTKTRGRKITHSSLKSDFTNSGGKVRAFIFSR